ncbi:MAG TPA: cobalt-precorrin-6A reductase [Solirubrobacteraceae bacterium]|jgi:precorrin-6A/cobalt-precorrin-6A reductase|nr:cobalt-precorrin-6A reductase [Solirubrobacteraceae bacterium]
MVLILGGTAEARRLAGELVAAGASVLTSLAGRVARPRLPPGDVRIGGFGGCEAFAQWLRSVDVRAVVDATHPFAERISASAAWACPAAGVPLLRLERPGWRERPGERWRWVPDLPAAAQAIPSGARVFLTTGRQGISAFAAVSDAWFLVRCVQAPDPPLPARHELLLARGPYALEGEGELLDAHRIDLLITKDSGGAHTEPKLDAARERGVPVVVVRRPPRPEVPTVATVREARTWAIAQALTQGR